MPTAEPTHMPVTEKLLELYQVEQQIRSLQTRVQVARRYSVAQQSQLAELTKRRENAKAQSRQIEALAANMETDVRAMEDRMTGLREKMSNATSSREYNALLTELNTIKADKSAVETRVLEELTKVDAIGKELGDLDREIANRADICEIARRQLEEENQQISERLGELESRRAALVPGIPNDVMSQFEQLSGWLDGEAMAAVIETDRRRQEYHCDACNMEVPIELVSHLLGRGRDLVTCPSCRRILYLHADARESFQK